MEVDFAKIESKWQKAWEKAKVFEVKDSGANPYYVLEMFPYPSGSGLHMGHAWNYTIGDIIARFKRMSGFNVLHPMGFDSLGLPAENAAIQAGKHPTDYTNTSIPNFMKQMKAIGLSYDWSRTFSSHEPSYYKWDQWIFLKMLEKGSAYQKTSAVNWCRKCNTVLANEQVHDGKCWRHDDVEVEVRQLKQWFLKTTEYANELYENLDKMDWPDRTKAMQKNWIGKSHGTEIDFLISKVGDIKDKEFVFLHAYGDDSKGSFWPWLKEEVESRGGKVAFAPDLPGGETPKIEEQVKAVLDNYSFNENTIVVGHSLGNILAMKILEDLNVKISGFIMVGSPLPREIEEYNDGSAFKDSKPRPALGDYCDWKFDYDAIKKNGGKIVVLEDENDHIVIRDDPKKLAEFLDAEYILSNGNKSHYNGEKEENVLDCIFEKWPIFTTRPDTLFGVTFMVVAAQHSKLDSLVTPEQRKDVDKFLKKLKGVSVKSAARGIPSKEGTEVPSSSGNIGDLEKEGVFTGSYATNPATNEKIPIWAANFVIADYGSGMVMADAHDQRDLEFAHKYGINLIETILPKDGKSSDPNKEKRAFTDYGTLVKSGEFDGLESKKAIVKITDWLIKEKKGRRITNFKLRDWGISRQRYWGTPIPVIHCEKCGAVPVPEKDLPVELPKDVKFGDGNPLETNEKWLSVKCPKCGGKGRRESDTMDTFANSSWYFMRYCDPKNDEKIFDPKKVKYWCPVDTYVGGAEHACMHLIYSRFYVKFLRDLGLIDFDEPAVRLFHQGMLRAEGGVKMSKSKPETCVLPEAVSDKYGIDTARFFLSSLASPDKDIDWSEKGIVGSARFVGKIFSFLEEFKSGKDSDELLSLLNKTIKNVSGYYDNFEYRKATIEIRELFDLIEKGCSKDSAGKFLQLLSPVCPHITEELWEKIGNKGFISMSDWPEAKEIKVKKKVEDLNSKVVERIKGIIRENTEKVYVYVMPFELGKVDAGKIGKAVGKDVLVYSVSDSEKKDPKGMAKRAKPGMAAIYLE